MVENPVVIDVQHVYKRYTQIEGRMSLRHEFRQLVKHLIGRVVVRNQSVPFYALRDITFQICKGESVAIIGRNGSGKTTLLRLLSRITKPTSGTVSINGRSAALIALGAGFNPEMSGYKNIYLNAAIHGLRPSEVDPLVPKIIEFADLGEFIHVPVKRYSSGMYARLGFSIVVHILPDIIFLDEVLAVGDQAFQDKCKERIYQLRQEQRTIIFVSHSPDDVERLCDRAIWLNKGALIQDGAVADVLPAYLLSF